MNDEHTPAAPGVTAAPDPEAERLARVAVVEQKRLADDAEAEREAAERREYNRIKKAESRAREKAERQRAIESAPGYHQKLAEVNIEAVTLRETQIRRGRDLMLAGELSANPIQKDELIDGESYWASYVQPEIEIFIDEQERKACGSWEHFYFWMSSDETRAGRKVLEFFGVEPLDLSGMNADHKFYLTFVHNSEGGPPVPTFVNLSPEERDAVIALHRVWQANRKAKEGRKP
jgi:hypothetical protein